MARVLADDGVAGVIPEGDHPGALRQFVPQALGGDTELATRRLDQIRPTHVEALVLRLRGKGLSDSTVRQVYTVLRAALDIAVRDGLLANNPTAR